ncbi:MAG TPA: adhesin, partial [Cytophagaceae bacterium]
VGDSILTLTNSGKVGINNNNPEFELDVKGAVAMSGRIGNAYQGKVLADGKWHPILTDLNGCHAFEIVAGIGKKKTGRYALIHAFALSTFGKSKSKIDIRQAYYGVRSNRIELKWTGTTYSYNLEMRTRNTYDGEFYIQYYISKLWFDQFMDGSVGLENK